MIGLQRKMSPKHKYWWNFFKANIMARASFLIMEQFLSLADRVRDAKAIGRSS